MEQNNERKQEQKSEFLRKATDVFRELSPMVKEDEANRSLMIFAKDDNEYEGGNTQNVICAVGHSANLVRLAAEILSADEIGPHFTMASFFVKKDRKSIEEKTISNDFLIIRRQSLRVFQFLELIVVAGALLLMVLFLKGIGSLLETFSSLFILAIAGCILYFCIKATKAEILNLER